MNKTALYIRLEAKPDKAKQVEEFLKNSLPSVVEEGESITWYALKFTDTAFGIFESFVNEDGRKSHLEGKVLQALFAISDELLDEKPIVIPVDLLASKIIDDIDITGAAHPKKYNLRFVDGL
ncbi:MAG: putative quinol monooxygenase [Methylophilaceae bacterium]